MMAGARSAPVRQPSSPYIKGRDGYPGGMEYLLIVPLGALLLGLMLASIMLPTRRTSMPALPRFMCGEPGEKPK